MMVILILKKLLLTAFYVAISYFSRIRFVIIPFTPKLVNYLTSVLLTTCCAIQQVDETFAVTVKIMIILYVDLAKMLEKVSVTCILVHAWHHELPHL